MHGVCSGEADNGGWTSAMGCNPIESDPGAMGCVGGLYGTSGDFEGRGGAFTVHVKGETSHGVGEWYE